MRWLLIPGDGALATNEDGLVPHLEVKILSDEEAAWLRAKRVATFLPFPDPNGEPLLCLVEGCPVDRFKRVLRDWIAGNAGGRFFYKDGVFVDQNGHPLDF